MVERQEDVATRLLRGRRDHVDGAAERVADDRLLAGLAGEVTLEAELQPRDARVVDPRVPEHLRRDAVLRIAPPLLRVEVEPGEAAPLERSRPLRVGLPLDVDEALLLVEQLRVDLVRVEVERVAGLDRDLLCVPHLLRVGVDRGRLLADRERRAHAVVDRPPAGRRGDRLVVLLRGQALQPRRAHDLQPESPYEGDREGEREEGEQEPDPAVRQTGVHA